MRIFRWIIILSAIGFMVGFGIRSCVRDHQSYGEQAVVTPQPQEYADPGNVTYYTDRGKFVDFWDIPGEARIDSLSCEGKTFVIEGGIRRHEAEPEETYPGKTGWSIWSVAKLRT